MKVVCWKVRCWLGEVRRLFPMRTETEGVREIRWETELMVVQSVALGPPHGSSPVW